MINVAIGRNRKGSRILFNKEFSGTMIAGFAHLEVAIQKLASNHDMATVSVVLGI